MPESAYSQCGDSVDWTADAAYSAGDMIQLPDGRAGQVTVDVASGATVGVRVEPGAILKSVTKTSGFVALKGNRAYWDHSANAVNYKKVNDRDFYIGRFAADGTAAGTDTTCSVILNIDPKPDIDMLADGFLSVATGTQAAGSTGFGLPKNLGKSQQLLLTATNEAQAIDMLSVDKFGVGANAIVRFVIRPVANGSGSACDINIGVSNGTHATDFEAVTQFVGFHIDGGSVNINSQSRDGVGVTVAVEDTTADISAGSAVANRTEYWIDMRDPADCQLYVDGVLIKPDSLYTVAAATTLGLVFHMEKTTGTETANFIVDAAEARFQQ